MSALVNATNLATSPLHARHHAMHALPIDCESILRDIMSSLSEDESPKQRFEDSPERFLGILGHDLRNPLTAVRMAAELLARDDLTERQSQLLSRIQAGAERMLRMVNALLDFTRGRSGERIPIVRAPVDMRDVCGQVVDEMSLMHPDRAPVFDAVGDLRGNWDGDRVAQVVSNLLANALQHGGDPVRLTVRADRADVVVEVSNGGEPIPQHILPTLFEPFQRTESSRQGLGLGLYIAREIVYAHGGSIEARSDMQATVFIVRWPRAR